MTTTLQQLPSLTLRSGHVPDINEISSSVSDPDEEKDYSSDLDETISQIFEACFPKDGEDEQPSGTTKAPIEVSDAAKWALSERKCSLYSDQLNEIMVMKGASSISSFQSSRKSPISAKRAPFYRQSAESGYSEFLPSASSHSSRGRLSDLIIASSKFNDHKKPLQSRESANNIEFHDNVVRVLVNSEQNHDKDVQKVSAAGIKSISGHHNDLIAGQGPPRYLRKCKHSSEFLLARNDKSLLPQPRYKPKR